MSTVGSSRNNYVRLQRGGRRATRSATTRTTRRAYWSIAPRVGVRLRFGEAGHASSVTLFARSGGGSSGSGSLGDQQSRPLGSALSDPGCIPLLRLGAGLYPFETALRRALPARDLVAARRSRAARSSPISRPQFRLRGDRRLRVERLRRRPMARAGEIVGRRIRLVPDRAYRDLGHGRGPHLRQRLRPQPAPSHGALGVHA